MDMTRLCVVDGTFELFRAFYGSSHRSASVPKEVAAAIALGRSLNALAKTGKFTHFAVAFDTVIESFRNELFAGYKTGEGIDPLLFAQFPLAERVTAALGFAVYSMVEFEADDALASAAAQFIDREDVESIVIASPDKDLMQCVRSGVTTWDRIRDKTYDEDGVVQKMGVAPRSIPDYLALVGDSADGIPGIPRWGARSAATVLTRYTRLEDIPRQAIEWDIQVRGAAALAEQLAAHEQEVLLYRRLATLRDDVSLPFSYDALKYVGPDQDALSSLSAELGGSHFS